jgi:hypothetical protein
MTTEIPDEVQDRLTSLMRAVVEAKHTSEYRVVIILFDALKMSDDSILLIGYLRATFSIRRQIPSWIDKRDTVSYELSRRGLDSKRLLRGLF